LPLHYRLVSRRSVFAPASDVAAAERRSCSRAWPSDRCSGASCILHRPATLGDGRRNVFLSARPAAPLRAYLCRRCRHRPRSPLSTPSRSRSERCTPDGTRRRPSSSLARSDPSSRSALPVSSSRCSSACAVPLLPSVRWHARSVFLDPQQLSSAPTLPVWWPPPDQLRSAWPGSRTAHGPLSAACSAPHAFETMTPTLRLA